MYIPPFWCGVISTILIEIILLIFLIAYLTKKSQKNNH